MKKLKIISNIFWMMSLIIIELVILQQYKIINFLPTTPEFFAPVTLEKIPISNHYTRLINGIGYVFLLISVSMKMFLFMQTQDTRILAINHKYLKVCIVIFKILLVILTLAILTISLLITLLALIDSIDSPI